MIDGKFDVVFRGQVVRNMDESVVKSNLVALFKSSPEAVDKLFSGQEVVVRKDLDYSTAMKYQSALKKAGALALIKEIEQPEESKPSLGKATFGASVEAEENDISASHDNENQGSHRDLAEKQASSSISESQLSEETPQSQNESINQDNSMSLADVGARILPDKIYEKRDVDTSELSLASVGERILPKKEPESHPQPSIDHLKLED